MNYLPTQNSNQITTQREFIVSDTFLNPSYTSRTEIFTMNTAEEVLGTKFSSKTIEQISIKNLQNSPKFDFDDFGELKCQEHQELKENFLMQNISGHNLYDSLCSQCLSELQQTNDDNIKSRLYSSVIRENREKIIQIKENKIDFDSINKTDSISSTIQENIMSLAYELISFTESFESEVLNKLSDTRFNGHDIEKIKLFIGEILNEKNEPVLKNIGKDEIRKMKYIKLAYFLLHFKGIENTLNNHSGISVALKLHLTRIIELRNLIVKRLTEWIRFILGNFYENVFLLEGVAIDRNFVNGLLIDYIGETDIQKIRLEYEQIIRIKDDRIRNLEFEINQLKTLTRNPQDFCETQNHHTDLHMQIKQIEDKWMSQNTLTNQLNLEIETLKNFKNNHLINFEFMKEEIIKLKSDFESKFQIIFIKLEEECKCKMIQIAPIIDNSKKFLLEGELRNGTNDLIIPNSELDGLNLEFRDNNGNLIPPTLDGAKYSVNLKEGLYNVIIKTKKFSEYTDEVLIENNSNNLKRNFLLSPSSKGIRVILVWNDKIKDLDLIATTSNNDKINYSSKISRDETIKLDIDKRDGYGPETLTVNENNRDDKITFTVHNYSNETHISGSEANVKVYLDDKLVENFKISNSSENSDSRFWELGEYNRSTNKFSKVNLLK